MDISIIIINYKTPKLTINCINSIFALNNNINKEIILIDNNSLDNSVNLIKKNFANKIKIIENNENLGFAKANNQGANISKGKYLLFLNSDTIIKKSFFKTCFNILEYKNIGAVSPRLKNYDGSNQTKSFGFFPTPWNLLTQKTKLEPKINLNNKYQTFDWISGCSLMIKKETFKKIGGWDSNFFLYFEDVDLCYRLNKINKKSAIALQENIIHLGGSSLKINKEKKKIYYYSQDYYLKKHYNLIILHILKIIRFIKTILK